MRKAGEGTAPKEPGDISNKEINKARKVIPSLGKKTIKAARSRLKKAGGETVHKVEKSLPTVESSDTGISSEKALPSVKKGMEFFEEKGMIGMLGGQKRGPVRANIHPHSDANNSSEPKKVYGRPKEWVDITKALRENFKKPVESDSKTSNSVDSTEDDSSLASRSSMDSAEEAEDDSLEEKKPRRPLKRAARVTKKTDWGIKEGKELTKSLLRTHRTTRGGSDQSEVQQFLKTYRMKTDMGSESIVKAWVSLVESTREQGGIIKMLLRNYDFFSDIDSSDSSEEFKKSLAPKKALSSKFMDSMRVGLSGALKDEILYRIDPLFTEFFKNTLLIVREGDQIKTSDKEIKNRIKKNEKNQEGLFKKEKKLSMKGKDTGVVEREQEILEDQAIMLKCVALISNLKAVYDESQTLQLIDNLIGKGFVIGIDGKIEEGETVVKNWELEKKVSEKEMELIKNLVEKSEITGVAMESKRSSDGSRSLTLKMPADPKLFEMMRSWDTIYKNKYEAT